MTETFEKEQKEFTPFWLEASRPKKSPVKKNVIIAGIIVLGLTVGIFLIGYVSSDEIIYAILFTICFLVFIGLAVLCLLPGWSIQRSHERRHAALLAVWRRLVTAAEDRILQETGIHPRNMERASARQIRPEVREVIFFRHEQLIFIVRTPVVEASNSDELLEQLSKEAFLQSNSLDFIRVARSDLECTVDEGGVDIDPRVLGAITFTFGLIGGALYTGAKKLASGRIGDSVFGKITSSKLQLEIEVILGILQFHDNLNRFKSLFRASEQNNAQ